MKRFLYFMLGLLIALALGLFAIAPAHAEYAPSDEFIAQMSERATFFEDLGVKIAQVGKPYQQGNAAYFLTAGLGTWILFIEQWETATKAVTYLMSPARAIKRVKVYEGTSIDSEASGKEEEILITSPEAIQASEQAQKILLKHAGEQEL